MAYEYGKLRGMTMVSMAVVCHNAISMGRYSGIIYEACMALVDHNVW